MELSVNLLKSHVCEAICFENKIPSYDVGLKDLDFSFQIRGHTRTKLRFS